MNEPNANEPLPQAEQGANAPGPAEPPLVTRPDAAPAPPVVLKKPRPGLIEAFVWCAVFIAVQMFAAVFTVAIAFTAFAFSSPDPKQFTDEQLAGFSKAVDPNVQGDRPPMPAAFGESLAWGMLGAQVASFALILIVFPRRIGRDWKRQLGVRTPHWLHIVLVLLIVPGFMITADAIQTLFLWATGIQPPAAVKALNSVFGPFPWPLTALAVAIGPGVVEELWCRGFLGRGLSARYGLLVGVISTSVFFSAMHIDPSQLLVIALMGAFLHFVYLATRSIWAPILLHATNNGLAILLTLLIKPAENDVKVIPIIVHVAALSLMIFASVALWTSRAKLVPLSSKDDSWYDDDAEWTSTWQAEYPGISVPPPEADARIGYAAVSPVAVIFAVGSFGVLIYLCFRYVF